MSTTETLLDLKVHKMSKETYDAKVTDGSIDNTAIYLTPEEEQKPLIVRLNDGVEEGVTQFTYNGTEEKTVSIKTTYTNDTPIVREIGSIVEGQTFEDVTIQDMLTMILYPYIDLTFENVDIDTTKTANSTSSNGTYTTYTYYVHNIPKLQKVTLTLKKNSATGLSFCLYEGETNLTSTPLTENDIKDGNKLVFDNLNREINTSRTYTIRYSYNGEGNSTITSGTSSEHPHVIVGAFTISFIEPSKPSISHTVSSNSASGTDTAYYCGETANITGITTKITNLNSASATGGITKLELIKNNGSTAFATINPPTGSTSIDIGGTSKVKTFSFTGGKDALTSTTASSTTYKVRAYYNTRTGDSTATTQASKDSDTLTITFTYQNPTISLNGISGGTFSKLSTKSITNPTCSFNKNSGKITKVQLFDSSGNAIVTNDISGHDGDSYSSSAGTSTFTYSLSDTCINNSFCAKAYNGDALVASSSAINLSFYAPCCYGFVPATENINTITAAKLKTYIDDGSLSSTESSSPTAKLSITSDGTKKFLYAIPLVGSFAGYNAAICTTGDDFTSFENNNKNDLSTTTRSITFVGDPTPVDYQILITAVPFAKIDHEFKRQ